MTALALSVDRTDIVADFFEGVPAPAFEVGWAGDDGLEALQVDGVPAMFVIDAAGTVTAVTTTALRDPAELAPAIAAALASSDSPR